MCERLHRLASSAIRTSQLNQTTMVKAMNTLSQNAWPFWNGPPMRSLSKSGSCHANHSVTARPPISNSAMNIHAFGQSNVPADKNSNAPIDAIHNTALTESTHVTIGSLVLVNLSSLIVVLSNNRQPGGTPANSRRTWSRETVITLLYTKQQIEAPPDQSQNLFRSLRHQ